jgi:N utilization substance protein B
VSSPDANPASTTGPDPVGRPVTTTRSEARERALHLLYEAEVREQDLAAVLAEQVLAPDAYTRAVVAGVGDRLADIDAVVASRARGWSLGRMPAMDRAVLRMATYELLCEPEVPTAVVIDEAVELAKRYSTEDSGRFVNGVLSAVATEVRG